MTNQKYTLHTHTVGFDGQNTVADMVERAKELGFTTIGISNHFIVHPNIKQSRMYPHSVRGGYNNIYSDSFDEVMQKFVPHYTEIEKIKSEYSDMKILCGMEVDFFPAPQWQRDFEKCISILKPDYVIGSSHFIEYDNQILNSHDWKNADIETQSILLKSYWNKLSDAAQSGLFTWMAHLDLPNKVGLGREEKWAKYEHKAIESIAKIGGAIEINTGLYKTDCYEPYPSNRILQMAHDNNVPVLISDDAHNATQIGRHFDEAENLIYQFNMKRFEKIK